MVSVCLASFNGDKFIDEQIKSILTQLSQEDELIISDDSSTDNTLNIIYNYAKNDSRIKVFPHNQFKSPVGNFENALKHAAGDFIFLADQDDVWIENKIQLMVNELKFYDLVVCDCRLVDEDLHTIHESYFKLCDAKVGLFRNLFFKTSPYIGCCMAFRKSVLQLSLPFPKRIINHDYWIAMIGETYFKPKILHHALILFRRHSNNASNTGKRSVNSIWFKVTKRLNIIFPLIAKGLFSRK